ncbi:16S rRNA (cytosine(1402)-N(4))-methyltransferase RsmH [Lignipirellula cremea]|uniref:Ribosomal RNA small subunit methyltransferase H n=1 Tax=Lignipirellula cremea TaxID=2528010 RepID=A0A518E189_9BACT|nr:16S rRNA (cytosine(1402)-N(4))-methyltransferase RsmH [Lignipirellula cremea]QDU97858.1 Ribosomal RNA small subunit methyltransferase H [Lignipirellula cremea]
MASADSPREPVHISVMPAEVLQQIDPQPGQIIVDGTLGGGGHTAALAQAVGPTGKVLSFDRDQAAIASAERRLAGLPIEYVHANFAELPQVLADRDQEPVSAILLDLGLSSDQLADRERGFSFDADGPLDMRFDTTTGEPAWRLVETMREKPLADLIYQYGEERLSRRIARTIVEERRHTSFRTAPALADLVRRCVPRRAAGKIDPATRTFQALRIAVNDELGSLAAALEHFPEVLREGGILAVITFHSLEDRMVKRAFREDDRWLLEARKGFTASEEEIAGNPRSRSARLRVARRAGPDAHASKGRYR